MSGKTAGPTHDPYATSVQWSRRFIGLKLVPGARERGEAAYAKMIEHQTRRRAR